LILGSVLALVILSILVFSSSFGLKEPVHEGRRLSAWISDLSSAVFLAEQTRRAEEAIKQIGTNGLPVILDELRVPDDSAFVRTVHEKYKYSPLARKESPVRLPHREAGVRRMQAAHALRVLAQPLGLSTLTNLLNDSNPQVQKAVAESLVSGFTIEGVEALMYALGSESVQVRLAALHGLPGAGYIPQKIAPLIQCLADPNPEVRMRAASCLRQFSPVYRDIKIPGLIEGLETAAEDVDPAVRAAAQQALVGIRAVVASEATSSK
jgi:hypothetical protein